MKKFKKGDWVINSDFNECPFQLEEDEVCGFFDFMVSGTLFFVMTERELLELEQNPIYAIRDTRLTLLGKHRSYIESNKIRLATKKDFNKMIGDAKKHLKLSENYLKNLLKTKESYFNGQE